MLSVCLILFLYCCICKRLGYLERRHHDISNHFNMFEHPEEDGNKTNKRHDRNDDRGNRQESRRAHGEGELGKTGSSTRFRKKQ